MIIGVDLENIYQIHAWYFPHTLKRKECDTEARNQFAARQLLPILPKMSQNSPLASLQRTYILHTVIPHFLAVCYNDMYLSFT